MSHLHQRVSALVDGELKGGARTRAVAHLQSCPACRAEVEQTLALKQRLLGLAAAEPSADLCSSLAQVRASDVPGRRPTSLLVDVSRKVLVGAGSVSMAFVTLAYAVGGAEPAEEALVTPSLDEFTAEFAAANGSSPLSDPAIEALGSPAVSSQRIARTAFVNRAPEPVSTSDRLGVSHPDLMPRGQRADEQGAVVQLNRAVLAHSSVAYSGVRQVSEATDDTTITARIAVDHAPGQGTSYDVQDADDEMAATFVGTAEGVDVDVFAADRLALLVDAYTLTISGAGVVAERPATVVTAAGGGALAARFWIDDATGLLLRREMYDAGSIVRSSTFVSLRIEESRFLSHLPPELAVPATTPVSTQFARTLNDEGWTCPEALPDNFALTLLQRLDSDGEVVHASYSDGLSTVSVFEERGRLDARSLEGFTTTRVGGGVVALRQGMPTTAVWESDGTVYTVLTDAPPGVVTSVVAALPHADPDDGEGDQPHRLVRGAQRLASLVDVGD